MYRAHAFLILNKNEQRHILDQLFLVNLGLRFDTLASMDRPEVVGGAPFVGGSDHYAEMLKDLAGFGRTQVWDFNTLWVDRWNQRRLPVFASLSSLFKHLFNHLRYHHISLRQLRCVEGLGEDSGALGPAWKECRALCGEQQVIFYERPYAKVSVGCSLFMSFPLPKTLRSPVNVAVRRSAASSH